LVILPPVVVEVQLVPITRHLVDLVEVVMGPALHHLQAEDLQRLLLDILDPLMLYLHHLVGEILVEMEIQMVQFIMEEVEEVLSLLGEMLIPVFLVDMVVEPVVLEQFMAFLDQMFGMVSAVEEVVVKKHLILHIEVLLLGSIIMVRVQDLLQIQAYLEEMQVDMEMVVVGTDILHPELVVELVVLELLEFLLLGMQMFKLLHLIVPLLLEQ